MTPPQSTNKINYDSRQIYISHRYKECNNIPVTVHRVRSGWKKTVWKTQGGKWEGGEGKQRDVEHGSKLIRT